MTEPALDADDAAFVDAFLRTGNAPDACRAVGISPRKASAMMRNPDITRAIAARQAASATENAPDAISLDSLIADAKRAYAVAEREGNASAMVSAATLLARLTNRMDGAAPELKDDTAPPLDTRDASRAVIELLREAAQAAGWQIGFCAASERLIRVPCGLESTVGGEPAYSDPSEIGQPVAPAPSAEPIDPQELARAIAAALGPDPFAAIQAAIDPTGAVIKSRGAEPDASLDHAPAGGASLSQGDGDAARA